MPSKTLHLKTLRNHLLSSPPLPSPPSPFLLQNPSTKIRHQTLILLRIASSSQMLFSILLAFLFSSIHPAFSDTPSPAIFLTVCAQNQTADAESFDVSFVDAMEKIYRNITVSGFAAASSGSANLTVFVLGQCFSYLSSVNCQLCYSQSRVKLPHCLPSSSGRIFLDGCFLEYADRNTSDLAVDSADAFACSKAAVRDPRFADLTEKLVGNLTGLRADRNEYYRAGSVQVSSDLRVYGMAQCWRSLNASACAECLENGRQSIVRHCLPSDEAKAMNAGCFIRYSTDPFYLSQAAGDGAGSSSAHHSVIIAVTTVLGSLVLIGIALLWRMRRSFCGYVRDDAGENREIIEAITKSHLSYKYEDLGKATNNFSQNNKLGQGGYGAVYKGILPDGKEIAVKRLFFNTTNWVDQFFNEVTLISQVQHKNLVKLMGCSVEGPESLLVYEFLSNTSLDHYLFDSFLKTALDWQRRFNIIVGTAEGLAYLHSASAVRIIHRDIKASNILLDDKFRPKISDFGLARYFKEDQSHLSTGIAGTFGYMAPEYIIHGQLTERVDIYSYGVLVLEILAGRKNQSSIMTSEDGHSLMQQIWQHHNSNTLLMLLDSGLQGACSEIEVMKAFRVGLLCVQASPSLRPPMWKVVEMLTGRLNDLPEPARPPFLHGHGFGSQSQSRNSESSDSKSPLIKNINFDEDRMSVNQISVSMFQELLGLQRGLLLLSYTTFLVLLQVTTEDLLPPRPEFGSDSEDTSNATPSGKSAADCCFILSTRVPSTSSFHLIHRAFSRSFEEEVAPPPKMVSTPAFPSVLTANGEPSSSSLHISKQLMEQSLRLSSASVRVPSPAGNNSSSDSNASAVPPSLAVSPISHHSGCCEPNMVQRRGTQDCHCVYPVKVELFLWNVSQRSNWSNEFLEKLASQLNLQVTQFEIDNFYVVGLSGLNITMDIAPRDGISFSAAQVHAMNSSLTLHEVFIDSNVIGGYKVLNFTWFEPPAPSPAPAHGILPQSRPPSMSYLHKLHDEASDGNHQNLTIIVGICAALLIAVVITVLVIFSCRSIKGNTSSTKEIAKLKSSAEAASGEGSIPRPTSTRFLAFEELREATNNFEASSVLGEGGFGRVFKGVLTDGTAVAIKKLNSGGHQGDKEFLVEVEMLSNLHHRNLVKLVGYFSNSSQNLLCYELVPNGSLEAWLHGPLGANCPLNWDTRMKIALDSARGLAYLHEDSQPSVIHRDFKASNILLENNFHAKVSDFGLAKHAPEGRANYLSTRVMGTFGYVAPEYAMTGHLLVKCDVYSYGVVLLELLTGRRPVDMSQPSGQENLVTWARPILREKERLAELADPKLEGKYPGEDFARVCTIAAACVAAEASQRPTMGEVVQSLKMVQRLCEYQDAMPTPPSARPNVRRSSTAYESDGTSSIFSSGPFSGISFLDNDNALSRTAVFAEDLHEGR